jgi:DMSO/TMAO reductase YedYZ molybdopterin-dependent catalytic subunit
MCRSTARRCLANEAMIAYERNGEPAADAHRLRLVLPHDRHGARSVSDVVRVEVDATR